MPRSEFLRLNISEAPRPEYEQSQEVINHLLARQGKRPPFSDGRKISGYFAGGFFATARGIGVAAGMQEAGLDYAFDRLYGTSAGFLRASEFLNPKGPAEVLEYAKNHKVSLNLYKLTRPEYYLNAIDESGGIQADAVLRHPTELYVRLKNVKTGEASFKLANRSGQVDYLDKLQAAIALPVFNRGGVEVGNERFRDPLKLKDSLLEGSKELLASDATDIVIILSHKGQLEYLKNNLPELFGNPKVLILPQDLSKNLKRFSLRRKSAGWLDEAHRCEAETKEIFQKSTQ